VQRPLVYIKLTGGDVTKANSGVLDRIVIEVRCTGSPETAINPVLVDSFLMTLLRSHVRTSDASVVESEGTGYTIRAFHCTGWSRVAGFKEEVSQPFTSLALPNIKLPRADIDAPHAGDGGRSVYGGLFADEGFSVPHDQAGLVGMANHGEAHTNGSQFFITQAALPSWDSKYVVFGRVIEGMRTLKLIDQMETANDRPVNELTISECGML